MDTFEAHVGVVAARPVGEVMVELHDQLAAHPDAVVEQLERNSSVIAPLEPLIVQGLVDPEYFPISAALMEVPLYMYK